MTMKGLSLDQAPPISAPLRFFLTAPLFGIMASVLLFFVEPSVIMSRFSPETIAFVHLITIGVFSLVMLGAVQQMLPVLAGVTLPWALNVARIAHASLSIGVIALVYGLFNSNALSLSVAMVLLGIGFMTLLVAIVVAFKKVDNFTATVRSMVASVSIAFIILMLGEHLLAAHATQNISAWQLILADIHATLAIFGFVGLLIIGVTFQVLPMFYVAPRFKRFCKKYVLWLILTGLLVWSLFSIIFPQGSWLGKFIIALFFFAFATTVLKKLKERRRPISDVTIWYWQTGAFSLMIGLLLWLANDFIEEDIVGIVAIFIGGGFMLSIVTGMLYKIVPFLTWFHLNALGYMQIPTMRELISARVAKVQYFLYVSALVLGIASYWVDAALSVGAVLLAISFILLEYNLINVVLTYIKIKKGEPDFVMPSMEIT